MDTLRQETLEQRTFRRNVRQRVVSDRDDLLKEWRQAGEDVTENNHPLKTSLAVWGIRRVYGLLGRPASPNERVRVMTLREQEGLPEEPRKQFLNALGFEIIPVRDGEPAAVVNGQEGTRSEIRVLGQIFDYMLVEATQVGGDDAVASISYDMIAAPVRSA